MSQRVPQEILDALTRVNMPSVDTQQRSEEVITVEGLDIPVHRCACLVLGSGAAGLRAAVEAKRAGVDVLIASMSIYGGTSACSGSDKQTLHTAGTSNRGDDFRQLAQDIGSGGCMDHDTAYIEAVGSLGAMSGLQFMGLPLPQDRFGAVLRYQTDHDDVGRATSCGPRTSRLMVKVLAEEAQRLQIPFLKKCEGIKIIADETGIRGVVVIDREDDRNDYKLSLILCQHAVLATGGPGELYRDSVYPKHCYGSLGMLIEAGISCCNLTESQFGIGTRREEFPWNLSGTYVQVLPYIYSTDAEGNEYNFLADYYRTTQELVSNTFRKGYQWPFHATRMEDYKSSLLDLAIYRESQKGRNVFMDFLRNPKMVVGDQEFSLDRLDDDVRTYLVNNEAILDLPIDRLRQMNPLAIELYKMHGHDIAEKALPFNVSNQHMNGGAAVDIWNQTSMPSCYAVGEVSGTHGVTRPGGAALNAGQVGGMRCAQHIGASNKHTPSDADAELSRGDLTACIQEIANSLSSTTDNALSIADVRDEIQSRMSDKAGFICQIADIHDAHSAASALRHLCIDKGFAINSATRAADIFRWKHMALSSEAVLAALDHYSDNGGGSRGARAMCSADGEVGLEAHDEDLSAFRYIREREEDKTQKIMVQYIDQQMQISEQSVRDYEDPNIIFFEKNWHHYLTDNIYRQGFDHT
ncbi:MAG: FAD-binding protein [Planctomycetes bacterium]|nr:FAD-binding protein [Planctomycetota bacterium]